MMKKRTGQHRGEFGRGFTLLEALILMVIMSIVCVAAGVGLQSGTRAPHAADLVLATDRQLVTAMEQVRFTAMSSWASIPASTTTNTSTVTINGNSYTQSITYTYPATAPDGSSPCTDYVQITVQIGGQSMSTYLAKP